MICSIVAGNPVDEIHHVSWWKDQGTSIFEFKFKQNNKDGGILLQDSQVTTYL
jgi:hypothetical protein